MCDGVSSDRTMDSEQLLRELEFAARWWPTVAAKRDRPPRLPTPLFADSDHLQATGLQDILIFLLGHGSGERDLMVVRMDRHQFVVTHHNGFLARLVFFNHVVRCIRAFAQPSDHAAGPRTFLF